ACIAKAEAERKQRSPARHLIPAVSDIRPFDIVGLEWSDANPLLSRRQRRVARAKLGEPRRLRPRRLIVGRGEGDRQPPRWIGVAKEQPRNGLAAALSGIPGFEN